MIGYMIKLILLAIITIIMRLMRKKKILFIIASIVYWLSIPVLYFYNFEKFGSSLMVVYFLFIKDNQKHNDSEESNQVYQDVRNDLTDQKYYHAYEKRYKTVHEKGLLWFSEDPTPELLEWIKEVNGNKDDLVLEVGCGEGRDALFLAKQGFKITALDASLSAILKSRELADVNDVSVEFLEYDVINNHSLNKQFKYIYSIATLHMLVLESDRKLFLKALFDLLKPGGHLLLINMGDGLQERETDITKAFELQERNHRYSDEILQVTSTSQRIVNWEFHKQELEEVGFVIEKAMITENAEYATCMTVYLTKR